MEYRGTLNSAQLTEIGHLRHVMSERKIAQELGVSYGQVRGATKWIKSIDESVGKWEEDIPAVTARNSWEPLIRAAVWDIETTNLRSDIGTLIVASFFDLTDGTVDTRTIYSFEGSVGQREAALAYWVQEKVAEYDILVGHNSKAFDKNFVNGVLERHNLGDLPPRQHWDTYLIARYGFKGALQSYSMENLADVLGVGGQKDKPSKNDWRQSMTLDAGAIRRIAQRCEEDVRLNALIWGRMRRYLHKWKGE